MGDILFSLGYFICALTGTTVTYPQGLVSVPLQQSGGMICQYSIYQTGNDISLATIRLADGKQSIISEFCSAIVNNPIVLFCVLMIAVFIGVKLLRRLCDA